MTSNLQMNRPGYLRRIVVGLRSHPWRFFIAWFFSFSVFWTLLEPIHVFFPQVFSSGTIPYVGMVVVSLVVAALFRMPPVETHFSMPGTNTTVIVTFGDIFEQTGDVVIPANEYFDYDVNLTKEFTLHGQFITRYFDTPQAFVTAVDEGLAREDVSCRELKRTNRKGEPSDRNRRYPLGTTAMVPVDSRTFFLVAFTRESKMKGAEATVLDLWKALDGLWKSLHHFRDSEVVNVPLIGSGFSDIGLPDLQLLETILVSILTASKENSFGKTVRIVLIPDKLRTINLAAIRDVWRG